MPNQIGLSGLVLLLFLSLWTNIKAQTAREFINSVPKNVYNIKYSDDNYDKKCQRCAEVFKNKHPETSYGIHNVDGELIFSTNDAAFFYQLFQKGKDGIAVDVIFKEQYNCGGGNYFGENGIHRGYLLPPVYKKQLLKEGYQDGEGTIYVSVGTLPQNLRHREDLEYNFLLLSDDFLCMYNPFYDIPQYQWELLEMPLLTSEIGFGTAKKSITIQKKMQFVIPFDKNKSTFSEDDIQPFYDSLRLHLYNIKNIEIRAFSSVEGSTSKNIQLQNERAKSIQEAISALQRTEIKTTIESSENWVEFYRELQQTNFKYLATQSKEEIKIALRNPSTKQKLEPILSKHRKAIIFLDIEERKEITPSTEDLVKEVELTLAKKDIERSVYLHRLLFNESPKNAAKVADGNLLLENNQIAYEFALDSSYQVAIPSFLSISQKSSTALYNLLALLLNKRDFTSLPQCYQLISELEQKTSNKYLLNRLWINFYMLQTEMQMRERHYEEKNRTLSLIELKYTSQKMSSADVLHLAQYFVEYNAYEKAIRLLHPFVLKIDVDEDLLFYYLNLTLIDKRLTVKTFYRDIMNNAQNINQARFCHLFDTFGTGGITFQLLDNLYLKRNYCESCK